MKNKHSIFVTILAGYIVVIALLSVFIPLFSFRTLHTFCIDIISQDLIHTGESFKLVLMPLLKDSQYTAIQTHIKDLALKVNQRVTIIDTTGVVIADSDEDPLLMENHKSRPEIQIALSGAVGKSKRYSSTLKKDMLYIALPLTSENIIVAVERLSLPLSQIDALFDSLKLKIIYIALCAGVLSLLGAFFFSRSISNPIKELVNLSRNIAKGDFNARVYLKTNNEFKELADSFNIMTSQIKELFNEVVNQKEEIDRIVSSIQGGIAALDNNDIIKKCNSHFNDIAGVHSAEGKYIWEIPKVMELSDLVKRIRKDKANLVSKIEIDGKIFLCSAAYIPLREEIITIMYDITAIEQMERIKRDLIANVSHELKTPLTAIKGFIETIEEEEKIKNKEYIEIVKRHTNRLINIVQDLLVLSKLENKKEQLEKENLNIVRLIEKIVKVCEPAVNAKKLIIKITSDADVPSITADEFKLEQMFLNLIDNAIKYTDKGTISIHVSRENGNVAISVQDEGIGIQEEHLPRIFERFYVVDKSRSRKSGGTGLGLSIVKHIVSLHNGAISVKSELGKGTTFRIVLPESSAE